MVANLSALLYCWRDGNEPATENGEVAALAQLFQFSSMRVSNTASERNEKRATSPFSAATLSQSPNPEVRRWEYPFKSPNL